ncbi:MAG: barstar family protein [Clostridia bacterium]
MRDIVLDITPFEEKISLHRYLKEMLCFPFYYGANLDALHDELASETENLHITVIYPQSPRGKMAEYLPNLLRVFEDTARENYHLEITFQEGRSKP